MEGDRRNFLKSLCSVKLGYLTRESMSVPRSKRFVKMRSVWI